MGSGLPRAGEHGLAVTCTGEQSVTLVLHEVFHTVLRDAVGWGSNIYVMLALCHSSRQIVMANKQRLILDSRVVDFLGFFEFVHNVRKRGKALLGARIEFSDPDADGDPLWTRPPIFPSSNASR